MHISDGIISGEVCAVAGAAALIISILTLKKMDQKDIPRVAVVTAGIFVASLVHIKIGPASAHLLLNGLSGILLGVFAFPAILLALLLQAILFQHGGITTLGINALSIGGPALCAAGAFRFSRKYLPAKGQVVTGGIIAATSVFLSGALMGAFLYSAGDEFRAVIGVILTAHIPVSLIEGAAAAFIVSFLQKVKPEMLEQTLHRHKKIAKGSEPL